MEVQCPVCFKLYAPELGERRTGELIQNEFPNATKVQREQLQTGICSQVCWDKAMTPPPEEVSA